MKHTLGCFALAASACLSTGALAQPHPDISGLWTRGGAAETLFRPPPSGPGPVMTLRIPGRSIPRQAGDYNAPILQPWAKEVVRRQTDKVLAQEPLLADLGYRIRDVAFGPDGALYVLTDEAKGRLLRLSRPAGRCHV